MTLFTLMIVMTLFTLMIVMTLFTLMIVVIVMIVMVMSTLTELDRRDRADCGIHRHAIGFSRLNHLKEALLEALAIDDQRISSNHLRNLLSRRLEVMGIRTDRHDRDDIHRTSGELRHDIAEDVCGHHHRRQPVTASLARPGLFSSVTARDSDHRQSNQQEGNARDSEHERTPDGNDSRYHGWILATPGRRSQQK